MQFTKGMVVKSLKGQDSGEYYAVVGTDEKYVYVANGKTKKLNSPKRKNPAHLSAVNEPIINTDEVTDKVLRKKLNVLKKI